MRGSLLYATPARRTSRAGIASLCAPFLALVLILLVGHLKIRATSVPVALLVFAVPMLVLPITGMVLGVVAIVGQRRLWWLGILGLLLNGLLITALSVGVYSRLR